LPEDADGEPIAFPARASPANAETALTRGRLIHRLLQSLPEIAETDRTTIGAAYLDAFAPEMVAAERQAMLGEVMAVMADPAFAAVFAPGGRAEVDLAGRLERHSGPATVSGRIDRLMVTPDRVLIVDYKTNRPAPTVLAEVPPAYVDQLALYRLLLAKLYPGRTVSAALLWTDRPALMEIPPERLDSAAERILKA
jgi:ATP-dependent helicase/nuclease subunit A